jgi:hypothetical protein
VIINSAGNVSINSAFNVANYALRGSALGAAPITPVVYFGLPSLAVSGVGMDLLLEWLKEELGEGAAQAYLEDAYLYSTDLQ